MAKQVTKTPAIIAQMQKIAGEGVDVSNLPVFEAEAANTLPISKRGSIYNKAQMSEGMVRDIADRVNASGIPLHTLHMQGAELPVGRVFMGGTVAGDTGLPKTNLLFWVDPTHADLTTALDNSTIDSVSLGVLSEHALCSECGFDFFGSDATAMNFWDRTCANDHTVGVDGVHLNLTGVDGLFEMSLVSGGAVQNSKVVSGSKAKVSEASAQRLAASGLDPNAVVLHASTAIPKLPASQKEPLMADAQFMELTEKYASTKVDLSAITTKFEAATAQVADLTAKLASVTEAHATLEAASKDPAAVTAKLAEAEAALASATTFLRDQARKALVATEGDISKLETMTVAELTGAISTAQDKLATLFPDGGRSLSASASETAEAATKAAHRASFKTAKS